MDGDEGRRGGEGYWGWRGIGVVAMGYDGWMDGGREIIS